jgi:retron-type reverse transcriptase
VPPSRCSAYPVLDTSFRTRPIGTITALARILRCPEKESAPDGLLRLAAQASSLYRKAGGKRKADGTIREVFDVMFPLKTVQGRIQNMILKNVQFPDYLQGSIKGRGQASNARKHVGRRMVITEDVENFFPSTSQRVVFEIWHRFFGFPPDVSECLTKLTTKDGSLPQGAKTSPLLANLVFWQAEGRLVVDLRSRGIVYTRLVDDITCSAIRDLSHTDVDWVITKIRAMTDSQGFKLKPGKETIADAGSRMVTTKLVVNVKVALPSQQRSKTRAAVNAFAALPATIGLIAETKAFNRISGQLAYLTQYHPAEGKGLRAKLKASRRAQG